MRRVLMLVFVMGLSTQSVAGLFTDDALVQRVSDLETQQKQLIEQGQAMRLALDHERLKDLKASEEKKVHQDMWSGQWADWQHRYATDKKLWQSQFVLLTNNAEKTAAVLKQYQDDSAQLRQKLSDLTARVVQLEAHTMDHLLYQWALSDMKKDNPQQAEVLLNTLMTMYPQDHWPLDTEYWYGMAALLNHHYHDAVKSLVHFISAQPKDHQVPMALLSIYDAYMALGRTADAHAYRYRLLHDYPNSAAAETLKKKIATATQVHPKHVVAHMHATHPVTSEHPATTPHSSAHS